MKVSLSSLAYSAVTTAAIESFSGKMGLGFWTWFLVLSVFGILIFSMLCVRIFAFQPRETMLASMLGVTVICLAGQARGWFQFAGEVELVKIILAGIACAAAISWGNSFAARQSSACAALQRSKE